MDNTQRKQSTRQPISVLIADIHFSLSTLPLASASLQSAIDYSNKNKLPLIVAGDTHDSKANLRGECVNEMIRVFKTCKQNCFVMIGNHCKINEKSDEHSLNFLQDIVCLVDTPNYQENFLMIPYQADKDNAILYLKEYCHEAYPIVIMHQGIQGSNSGDYFQDKSALSPEDVAGRRIVSGHYHRRQTIKLPDGGAWDYIGNPYTLNFGEANDPPKGFQILMDDGSLEFVPTNLRKHVILDAKASDDYTLTMVVSNPNDIVKIKVSGTKEELSKVKKSDYTCQSDFKLELIPTDSTSTISELSSNNTQEAQLDEVIDCMSNISDTQKARLKAMWRSVNGL